MKKPKRKKAQTQVLVDSSVWLDLAKDYRLLPVLDALSHLIDADRVRLFVPNLVVAEFERNKARVTEDARRGLSSHFKRVREAVARFADDEEMRNATLQQINELDRRIALRGEAASESVEKIEALLKRGEPIVASDAAVVKAAQRGVAKVAPFHLAKNSMADAILIEIFAELLAGRVVPDEMAFVTSNIRDFSEHNGDQRKPHADLSPMFGLDKRSLYLTSMVDLVRAVDGDLLAEMEFERTWDQEPRRLSEILEAEHLLFRQVWYNRHWNLRIAIEEGRHKVLPREQYSTNSTRTTRRSTPCGPAH
jgi:rRNA-processing protein FCF1